MSARPSPRGWIDAPPASARARAMHASLDRSVRQPTLIDAPQDLAARLARSSVVVVGAGSVGLPLIETFARLGVGELRLCDARPTKPESLLTHPIEPGEVGVPKARLAASRAVEISPDTRVRLFEGPFEALPLDALVGATAVFLATDNLAAEVAVSQAALHLALPLIQASVFGSALMAQVRSLPGGGAGAGACVCCGYLARDWSDLDAGTRFSCAGETEPGASLRVSASPRTLEPPTRSLPQLCGLAGQLAAGEFVAELLSLRPRAAGESATTGSSLEFCAYHGGTQRSPLPRDPDCPLDHRGWSVRTLAPDVSLSTPQTLARLAGHADLRDVSLRVDGHVFSALLACACDRHTPLARFHPADAGGQTLAVDYADCPDCPGARVPHPLHSHLDVPGSALLALADRPLVELGVAAGHSVLVRGRNGATLVRSAAGGEGASRAGETS